MFMQHLRFRDGVLLCHVASTIDKTAINEKNVNARPQNAQFLCLKNIRIFLKACKDTFQLPETDLFQPSMLYDFADFARVLHTLSRLSHCKVTAAKRPDIKGFPVSSSSGLSAFPGLRISTISSDGANLAVPEASASPSNEVTQSPEHIKTREEEELYR